MQKTQKLLKYRQGDVYIFAVEKTNHNFKQVDTQILAYGEVTGHKHEVISINGLIAIAEINKQTYLRVIDSNATVKHEEHHKIDLPEGDYKIVIQREYDPILYQRKVRD